jgi:hypothetical protein
MYKYIIYYDGGFMRDSSDFEWGVYKTYEEAEEEANMMKESYMDGWNIDGCEYDPDDFEIEIKEIYNIKEECDNW